MKSPKSVQLTNAFCGPFRLDTRLREDGPYEFYEAHHTDNFQKRYLAKVLKPGGDSQAAARLQLEFDLLKGITGSGIPNAFRLGQAKDQPCLVMESITGSTLADLIERQEPFDRLAALVTAVKLIAFLHEKGFLHNRISPAAFTLRDSDHRLFLTDFDRISTAPKGGLLAGLFKRSKAGAAAESVPPDPVFGAPELREGRPPSPKSDVFALGALGFCLLRDPTAAAEPTPAAGSRTRPVSLRGGTSGHSSHHQQAGQQFYLPTTPAEVVDLVESCRRNSPESRPANAVTLLEELWPLYRAYATG